MPRAIAGAFALVLLFAAPAAGQPQPYDGHIPFACTLQQAGTGTDFPDPNADPFCVEFDKTHQNATELGVVQFLSMEPARVAAASPKCFYFQRDHWTGSVVQGQSPETYHWDGSYFFDKARGLGGVYVENFRIGGQTGDPSTLPGFPAEWKPYFSSGRGGVQSSDSVQADPRCATKPPSGSTPSPAKSGCRVPGGRIGNGIAGLKLGATRRRAKADLGKPTSESARYLVWCLDGGGRIVAVLRGRVRLLFTDSAAFDTRGIRVGTGRADSRRRMRRERRFARIRGAQVYAATEHRRRLYVAFRGRRVAWMAISAKRVSASAARRYLRGLPK